VASGNAKQVVADDNSDNLPTAGGGLYNAEAVTSDPLSGLVGNGSMSRANEDGGVDPLFCVPGEDGTICSPSGGQGQPMKRDEGWRLLDETESRISRRRSGTYDVPAGASTRARPDRAACRL